MSEAPAVAHQPTPLPDQLRDFVPNRPPDFHYPAVGGPTSDYEWRILSEGQQQGQEITCAAVWLPTETELGYAYARIGEVGGGTLVDTIATHANNVMLAEGMGLKDAMTMAGMAASRGRTGSAQAGDSVSHIELIFPTPEQFSRGAERAADAGLTYARFTVANQPGQYPAEDLVRALGVDGRMLISPFDSDPNLSSFSNTLHDMFLHGLGHMGLAQEVVARKLLRGKIAYWLGKVGIKAPGRWLCRDVEIEIGVDTLSSCVTYDVDEFESFSPFWHRSRAAKLTRRHIATRREIEHRAATSMSPAS